MINICRKHGGEYIQMFFHIAGNGNYMHTDYRNNAGSCVHWGPKAGRRAPHGGILVGNLKIMIIMEKGQSLNFLFYPMFYLASIVKSIKIH